MKLLDPVSWVGGSWHIGAVTKLLDVIRERVSTPSLPVNYHTVAAVLISWEDIICVIEWGLCWSSPLAPCSKCMGIPETAINYTSAKKLYASVHSISISKHPLGIHIFQLAWRGLRADWPHERSSMSLLAQGSLPSACECRVDRVGRINITSDECLSTEELHGMSLTLIRTICSLSLSLPACFSFFRSGVFCEAQLLLSHVHW